jgi:hypothetical protein
MPRREAELDRHEPDDALFEREFPSGSWRSALDFSIDHVNQNPSPFRFTKSYDDTSIGIDNGQNEAGSARIRRCSRRTGDHLLAV